ncbi:MAG: hypothetical protein RLZZ303_3137 [Candidatus Hydrogenedentota bacterium]|jgi:ABC-2 type transport system ATP-binding protein
MIETNDLTKRYGAFAAIRGVTFSVAAGEVVGFLGPNGAGKSTTMRILTGFMPATSGTAKVAGHEVHSDPLAVKRSVGYMPERVPLYEEMAVTAFLDFVARVKGLSRVQRKEEIARALERCGLTDMARRMIGNLSKGYRQRVGLAQALLGNPSVLVLDEPTAGLDPKQIIEIRELIKSLRGDHTVLLSTHILPEVEMVCERVVIVHRGRVVSQERLDAITGARSLEDVFMEAISRDEEAAA